MKSSDITDEAFIDALEPDGLPTMIWDLEQRLGYPRKVVLAKARTMIERRRTVDGCPCGCRGDFALIEAQEARWARSSLAPAEMWPVVASVARKALAD